MKSNQTNKSSLANHRAIRLPVVFALLTATAVTLWFSAAPSGRAGNTCTVCHKMAITITGLACDSLEYRRHKDHGDPDGPCAPTTGETP